MARPSTLQWIQKPVDGYEIRYSCDGQSKVMTRLNIVESSEEKNSNIQNDENWLPHRTAAIKELLSLWFHSEVLCIAAAGSYFLSITTL